MKSKEQKRMEAEERTKKYQLLTRNEKLRRNSFKVWAKMSATEEEILMALRGERS